MKGRRISMYIAALVITVFGAGATLAIVSVAVTMDTPEVPAQIGFLIPKTELE